MSNTPHNRALVLTAFIMLSLGIHATLLLYQRPAALGSGSVPGDTGLLLEITRSTTASMMHVQQQPAAEKSPAAKERLSPAPSHKQTSPAELAQVADAAETTARPVADTLAGSSDAEPAELPGNMIRLQLQRAMQPYFEYPKLARRRGWEGTVTVGLQISPDGVITNVRIIATSNYRVLDQAAVNSIRKVRQLAHANILLAGRVTEVELPIEYRLTDT